ncbi:hypothetical protein [Anaerobutyricum hallii]
MQLAGMIFQTRSNHKTGPSMLISRLPFALSESFCE